MVNPSTVKLNDGNTMPLVGFGLWKVPPETAPDQVYNVIRRSILAQSIHHLWAHAPTLPLLHDLVKQNTPSYWPAFRDSSTYRSKTV